MFAVLPLSSPKDVAALRPTSPGSHDVSLTDVALIAATVAVVLAVLAPSVALATAVVAGIGAVAWVGLRVAANPPQALVEAHLDALARATGAQISFAR